MTILGSRRRPRAGFSVFYVAEAIATSPLGELGSLALHSTVMTFDFLPITGFLSILGPSSRLRTWGGDGGYLGRRRPLSARGPGLLLQGDGPGFWILGQDQDLFGR